VQHVQVARISVVKIVDRVVDVPRLSVARKVGVDVPEDAQRQLLRERAETIDLCVRSPQTATVLRVHCSRNGAFFTTQSPGEFPNQPFYSPSALWSLLTHHQLRSVVDEQHVRIKWYVEAESRKNLRQRSLRVDLDKGAIAEDGIKNWCEQYITCCIVTGRESERCSDLTTVHRWPDVHTDHIIFKKNPPSRNINQSTNSFLQCHK